MIYFFTKVMKTVHKMIAINQIILFFLINFISPKNLLKSHELYEKIATQRNNPDHYFNVLSNLNETSNEEVKSRVYKNKNLQLTDIFNIIPKLKAKFTSTNQSVSFSSPCFQNNTLYFVNITKGQAFFEFTASNSSLALCNDIYLFFLSKVSFFKYVLYQGKKFFSFSNLDQDDINEIRVNGLRVFSIQKKEISQIFHILSHIHEIITPKYKNFDFYKNFYSPISDEELKKLQGKDFLEKYDNFIIEDRKNWTNYTLPIEKNIKTGDLIGVSHFLHSITFLAHYWVGSIVDHLAMAIRHDNGSLYIYESDIFGTTEYEYEYYILDYENVYTLYHFPLKEEYRKKFDVKKAIQFFNTIRRKDFIYNNFFFSHFDTPSGGLPKEFNSELFMVLFQYLEKEKPNIYNEIMKEGLNNRMGTKNKTLNEIVKLGVQRNMTFEEILAMPELDNYTYSSGPMYICSSFVVEMYRQGGLFENVTILPHEFDMENVLSLDFFDTNWTKPDICEKADPGYPYCVIRGRFRFSLNRTSIYGTIKPYDHMFERCGGYPPDYENEIGC